MSRSFTFTCWKCEKESNYIHPAQKPNYAVRMITMEDRIEKRTYYCEHCKAANEIEMRKSEWMLVG